MRQQNMAVAIAGGGDQSKRRELDFYPTPPDATLALIHFLRGALTRQHLIWEPACGEGHMAEVFKQEGYQVRATDLRHTGYGVGGVDFLTCAAEPCDAIITNPPFVLAAEFIERAVSLAPIVAMLLKSQYWHAAKRLPLFHKNPPTYVLPLSWRPDFNGLRSPTMDCLWSVWLPGRERDTRYRVLPRPEGLV